MFCSLLSLSFRNQSHTFPALSSSIGHPSCSDITFSKFSEDIYKHKQYENLGHILGHYMKNDQWRNKILGHIIRQDNRVKVSTVRRHRKRSWVLNPDISTKPASSSVKNVFLSLFFSSALHLTFLLCTFIFLCAIRLVFVCLWFVTRFEGLNTNVVWRHDL